MRDTVLIKSNVKNPGGLEKFAHRLAEAFIQRGDKVSLLTSGGATESGLLPMQVHSFSVQTWPPFLRMEQFDRAVTDWLGKNRADIIFGMDRNRKQTHIRCGNGVHAAYLKSRIRSEGRWKYWTCLINPLHRKILSLEKEGLENRQLQKIFTNSYMVKREILEHYDVSPTLIEVIHNGVEWEEMETSFQNWKEGKTQRLTHLALDHQQIHFLFIGNGYQRKGLDALLQALSIWEFRDFHLTVIGKDKHLDAYREKARNLGLKERVLFLGPQPDVRPFYQMADALLIPSFYDPFANVTVEALAMGLFVVTSPHNGGSEILNFETGCVIENLLDPFSILEALWKAVRRPKTEPAANMRRNSVKHLDFSRQLKRYLDLCA
ncbi:MAG: glycosyltransferase family 4 protein [Chlamydiia bacterium]|nr:glycosyltransferase family 4 protein [Chlamydiia bacterium]